MFAINNIGIIISIIIISIIIIIAIIGSESCVMLIRERM